MKWAILIFLGLVVYCYRIQSQSRTVEQKVYLPHCSGSWYVDSQGEDEAVDGVDWALLRCTDEEPE